MSRQRALKKRADFRNGGFVDRKKFQDGSSVVSTDRGFGERTTEVESAIPITTKKADPTIKSTQVSQIEPRTPTASPEDITATSTQAAQTSVGQARQQTPYPGIVTGKLV